MKKEVKNSPEKAQSLVSPSKEGEVKKPSPIKISTFKPPPEENKDEHEWNDWGSMDGGTGGADTGTADWGESWAATQSLADEIKKKKNPQVKFNIMKSEEYSKWKGNKTHESCFKGFSFLK